MLPAPFDLNLRHLRALAAIVARGSMSAAADAVNLSQPALTQGLAKLERQLGERLFERRFDGVTPTPAGLALAERADAAFRHLAAARGAGRSARGFSRPEALMTATQLRAWLALADVGSFVEAARATGLSQAALHRAVRDLVQVLALPLAERRGRGIAITEPGRRLARGVRLARAELAAGIAEAAGEAEDSGVVAIGAMPLSRALLLPAAIARFQAGAPRAAIDVVEGSWRELVEPLRDGAIDLMIGALRAEVPPGLVQRALFVDRLAIVARPDHPLASEPAPALDALARYPWIVGRTGSPLRGHWEALFEGRTLPAAPIACGSVMTIRGILGETDCLTLLSPDQVALEIRTGLLGVIGHAGGERVIGMTTREGWRPTMAQARFIGLVKDAARENTVREIE